MAQFEVVIQRTLVEELIYHRIEADSFCEAESICLEMAKDDDGWRKKELIEEDYCVVFSDGDY